MDRAPRRRLAALVRHARPERAASSSPLDALCAELGITEGVKMRLLEKHGGDAAKVMALIQEVVDDLDADAAELEAATAVGVGVPGGVDVAGLPILDHSGDATLLGNATLEESYDFVVCGAGSAGAIVASRLSENPKWQVLLVEAGAEDRMAAMEMPAAVAALQRGQADWAYETEPMEGAALGAMPPTASHQPLCLYVCLSASASSVYMYVRAHCALLCCFCSDDRRAGKVAAWQGPRRFFSAELYALRPRSPGRLRQLGRAHPG